MGGTCESDDIWPERVQAALVHVRIVAREPQLKMVLLGALFDDFHYQPVQFKLYWQIQSHWHKQVEGFKEAPLVKFPKLIEKPKD